MIGKMEDGDDAMKKIPKTENALAIIRMNASTE